MPVHIASGPRVLPTRNPAGWDRAVPLKMETPCFEKIGKRFDRQNEGNFEDNSRHCFSVANGKFL